MRNLEWAIYWLKLMILSNQVLTEPNSRYDWAGRRNWIESMRALMSLETCYSQERQSGLFGKCRKSVFCSVL